MKHSLTKHGWKPKWYSVLSAMKDRCYNSNSKAYKNYGGRGITVCDEWRNDYKSFYEWAITNGYKEGLTIDRVNNNGNYEPTNCRWIVRQEQNRNHRANINITYKNKTKCLSEWSKELNIHYETLRARFRRGWDIEKAFGTKANKKYFYKNKKRTIGCY